MSDVKFGSLFHVVRNGLNVKQDKSGDGLPITRIETISHADVDGSRVGYAGLDESDCREWLLEPGDILFSHINSVEHVGKCAVYRGAPKKLVHGMNLLCLRPDQEQLAPEFAKYLIRSSRFRSRLSSFINKAVNQASVSISNLRTIPVHVPALPQQYAIAEVLDRAAALRAKRQITLTMLADLRQALFGELFGDPLTNPRNWPIAALSELGVISTGRTPPTKSPGMFGGSIPFATPGDLDMALQRTERTLTREGAAYSKVVRAGSTLVACIGSIGKIAKAPFPVAFNQQINAVEWGAAIDDNYGVTALGFARRQMLSLSSSTTVPILNKSSFGKIRLQVPPPDLQRQFASYMTVLDRQAISYQTAARRHDDLFASLEYRAFHGEL